MEHLKYMLVGSLILGGILGYIALCVVHPPATAFLVGVVFMFLAWSLGFILLDG